MWFTRPVPAVGHAVRRSVRPSLEWLESREAPVGLTTSLSFAGITSNYLFLPVQQQEKVVVNVNSPGNTVRSGQVTIADGGQVQTVGVNNGLAQATFTFNGFLGEMPGAHTVTANYSDPSNTFAGSTASTSAPSTLTAFNLQFGVDFGILAAFVLTLAAAGGSTTTSG
jgi:hypothetical protein